MSSLELTTNRHSKPHAQMKTSNIIQLHKQHLKNFLFQDTSVYTLLFSNHQTLISRLEINHKGKDYNTLRLENVDLSQARNQRQRSSTDKLFLKGIVETEKIISVDSEVFCSLSDADKSETIELMSEKDKKLSFSFGMIFFELYQRIKTFSYAVLSKYAQLYAQ